MTKVKVGVIGVGVLGKHHTRLHRDCEQAQLVGIYDVDSNRAEGIAKEFNTHRFGSIDELIDSVDGVSVAVPTDLHYKIVSELLLRGKHVLVEKPLTSTIDDGKKLLDLARNQRCILHVGHVERYNPVITYLEKKICDPRFIETHRLALYPPPRPGMLPRGTEVGVVLDLMIHDIDVILNLVKSDVVQIDAVGIPILSSSEDIANVRIKFASGCVANLTASRVSQEKMRKIRIFQSDAYLSLDYQNKKGEIVTLNNMSIKREPVPIADHDALQKELEDFIQCCQGAIAFGTPPEPRVPAEHGLNALAIADRITHQIRMSDT